MVLSREPKKPSLQKMPVQPTTRRNLVRQV
jgi:hypothetical protein